MWDALVAACSMPSPLRRLQLLLAERDDTNTVSWTRPVGVHDAAMEAPDVLAEEICGFFAATRPL